MKRVAGAVIGVALVLGLKFYNKNAAAHDVKARLVELCEQDSACVAAVDRSFDACFEQAYKMGGRRQSSRLESDQLVKCVNDRAGQAYFAVSKDKE
jgi:hypothetical protein